MKQPTYAFFLLLLLISVSGFAQRGYYDAPYKRYEAESATAGSGAVVSTKSYNQTDIQSEASDQQCVNLNDPSAFVSWQLTEPADGLVLRYSVPDGETGTVAVYDGTTLITTLILTSTWSWESLFNNGNSNNIGVVNQNPKMRFDEVRYRLPALASGIIKLVRISGDITVDFIEMEPVPPTVTPPTGAAVYSGDGSTLQAFIDMHGGQLIYLPAGVYNVNRALYFGIANTSLAGAGMWNTQINFTSTIQYDGGLMANADNISYSDLYLTTVNATRSYSYKAINGVYTAGSTIRNIWAEHFECGAWIAQYNLGGPEFADGFTLSNCRFRNNYADGINLCKGTSNAIVEHCNFRNNGDDDQAVWCSDGLECINNTFRYNTSENCWRASGVAFYGGKSNKAYNLIIKDNLESGIRISNNFPGIGFSSQGQNQLHDITVIGAGTQNDLYNQRVGAIDIFSATGAGTRVRNIKIYNIDLIDSKCDALLMQKKAGEGIYSLAFENITINGTGKEYPYNNALNVTTPSGFFTTIGNFPYGNATYCNMQYSNRGGTATTDESTTEIGIFNWSQLAGCSLGIPENTILKLAIYPNPANDEITLEGLQSTAPYKIYNSLGQLIQSGRVQPESKIGIRSLAKGLYYLHLNNTTLKMVKE